MAGSVAEYSTLAGGIKMPTVGLGTFMSAPEDVERAVKTALDCGYKHIDTAYVYQNEAAIGKVLGKRLAEGSLKREDIFVTSKLSGIHMGPRDNVRSEFFESLKNLQLDYLDLYLIHCPVGMKLREDKCTLPRDKDGKIEFETYDLVETWKAMEELVDEGKIRAIGLSNHNSKQIAQIQKEARLPIATVQVECHVYFQQNQLHDFCTQRGIQLTAYATFGSPGTRDKDYGLLQDLVVKEIAKKHQKNTAQVLLRWAMQRGIFVLPKSITPSRIRENIKVFDFSLDEDDMAKLKSLDRNQRLFTFEDIDWPPHPYYPFHEAF